MQISSINLYRMIPFGKERDEYQPLSEAMKDIFRENTESKQRQRLLWELSEVPDFYEASKNSSKQDLLELADFVEGQKTNILRMALDGDIKVLRKAKDGSPKFTKLLSLADFVRQNSRLPESQRKSLLEYLREHFVAQVEEDAIAQKFETKKYPKDMRYIKFKDDGGKICYSKIKEEAATLKSLVNLMSDGIPFDDDDMAVIFEQDIEKRTGDKVRGFFYKTIDPETVEDEYAVAYPAVYRELEENWRVPSEIRSNVAKLRQIPFFRNLTKNTYPQNLFLFSQVNISMDNVFEKMLKKEVTLDVKNPVSGEYIKTPIIDIGRLLYERKEGKIQEQQIDDIIKNHTLAYAFGGLCMVIKEKLQNQNIKSVHIKKIANVLGFAAISEQGAMIKGCFTNGDNEYRQKILEALDKIPFKEAILNFNSKE